jgi:hypothetical protein
MMMKVSMPVEKANEAIKNGSLPQLIESTLGQLRPEAAYFFTDNGERTGFFFFDMKDSSQMPAVAEPLFLGLNAKVTFAPVMNITDLRTGLEQAFKK